MAHFPPNSPLTWILQAFSSRARKNFEFNRRKGQDNHAAKGVKAPLPAVFLPFLLLFIPEAHSLRNDLPEEKPTKGIDKAESGALERGGIIGRNIQNMYKKNRIFVNILHKNGVDFDKKMWHNYMTSRTGSRNARIPPQSAKEPFRAYARARTHAHAHAYAHAYAHAAQFVRHGKECPSLYRNNPYPTK